MSNLSPSAEQLGLSLAEYSQRLSDCGTPLSALRTALPLAAYHTDRSEAVVRATLRKILHGTSNLYQLLQHHQPTDFLRGPLTHQLDRFAAAERIYNTQLGTVAGIFAAAYQEQVANHEPLVSGYQQLMQHLRCLKCARDNYIEQFHSFRQTLLAASQS